MYRYALSVTSSLNFKRLDFSPNAKSLSSPSMTVEETELKITFPSFLKMKTIKIFNSFLSEVPKESYLIMSICSPH